MRNIVSALCSASLLMACTRQSPEPNSLRSRELDAAPRRYTLIFDPNRDLVTQDFSYVVGFFFALDSVRGGTLFSRGPITVVVDTAGGQGTIVIQGVNGESCTLSRTHVSKGDSFASSAAEPAGPAKPAPAPSPVPAADF